jgi:hypothetical protein
VEGVKSLHTTVTQKRNSVLRREDGELRAATRNTTIIPGHDRTEDQVKQALYGVALQDLRNEHLDEFTKHVTDLYATYGLHYKKRLSEEERAEQQVRALFAAHPDLAAKVAPVPVPEPLVSNDPVAEPGTV